MKKLNKPALSTIQIAGLKIHACLGYARRVLSLGEKRCLMALALLWLLLHPHTGLSQNKMYWTDEGTQKIQRANLDGTGVEDLVTTGLSYPQGIALDVAAGKMYWTDRGTLKIQRANLDGSSVEDLVTTGLIIPSGIALDLAAGKIYWTDRGTLKIQRANLDGSSVEDLVTTGIYFARDIALDVAAGKMYWTDQGTQKIQRANLDGTSVEDLVTGLSNLFGIALDVAAGKMYWTDVGTNKIQRANLDGTGVEDLVTTGLSAIVDIALDVAAGKMYWSDLGIDKIQRANLDGSSVEDLVTTGLSYTQGIALDVTVANKPFVFLAEDVTINRQGPSQGDIHANNDIMFKKGNPSTFTGNLTAADDIIIATKNTINGSATAGDQISVASGSSVSSTNPNSSVPTEPLPNPSFTAGGDNVTVAANGSLTLPADSYGTAVVNKNATLNLSAGDYFFTRLELKESAKLVINVGGGEVNINVVEKLIVGKKVVVSITPSGEAGSEEVTFTQLDDAQVTIGENAKVLGNIIAVEATVKLAKKSRYKGAIIANKIVVDPGAVFLPNGSSTPLPSIVQDVDEVTDVESEAIESEHPIVESYALAQNYPNPFNPTTVISFQLPVAAEVSLSIYNINGQLVRRLANGEFAGGRHSIVWDAADDRGLRVSSGVYFYVIKAGEFNAQRKLVLMK